MFSEEAKVLRQKNTSVIEVREIGLLALVVSQGFIFVGVRAVWITDSDAVVFYDQDGGHLRTITISEGSQRVAA